MNAIFSRFPHIGDTIFMNLSVGELADCREVDRTWMQFINSQRVYQAHIRQVLHDKAVPFYIQNGIFNPEEKTPIHAAAIVGHTKVFERLWDDEIRLHFPFLTPKLGYPNIQGIQRRINSPLHFAASLGHSTICSYILDSVKNLGMSLFVCKEDGEIQIRNLIPRNSSGDTPLHKAAENNNAKKIFELILPLLHCDKNPKNNHSGVTPLHLAAKHGHLDICEYIIDLITPNEVAAESQNSWTALHHAAEKGHTQICQLIIGKVQNPHPRIPGFTVYGILIPDGRTPRHLARINGHNETAALFN